MLGDAQAIQNGGMTRSAVHLRRGNQVLDGNATRARHIIGGELLHLGLHDAEPLGALAHEFVIGKPQRYEQIHHAVGERHIGAGTHAQMDVGLGRKPNATRIHHDEAAPALNRLTNAHADDRMRLFGVGAHQHDDVGMLHDVVYGIGHCT